MPVMADPDYGDIPWQNPYAVPRIPPPDPAVPQAGGGSPMNAPALTPSVPTPPAPAPTPGAGQAPGYTGSPTGSRGREIASANDFFGYIGNLMNPGGQGQGGYLEELLRQLQRRPGSTVFTPGGLNDLAGGFSYAGTPAGSTGGTTTTGGTGGYGGFLGGLFGLRGGR